MYVSLICTGSDEIEDERTIVVTYLGSKDGCGGGRDN